MIRLENVTCTYPGAPEPTLRGVDLRVAPGRCVLLRGGSGGGKSTLVRLACGVIPHLLPARVTGRVLAAGADVGAQALHETGRTLASVFQDCRSQFFMTHVAEELVFAADNYGRPRERTAARLARFAALMDVTGLMERSVFRLSSGERQRVAIAAAAVQGPEALVLDEPSANLDAAGMRRLAELLAALKAEGRALLVADHRTTYLDAVADEVLFLEGGHLTPTAPPTVPAPALPLPEPASRAPLLELRGVGVARGGRVVLRAADLTLCGGEVLAVCGGNGAGKTSLLRTLCGLERPAGGRILLRGGPGRAGALRRACALVMQDPDYQLFAPSVREELALGHRSGADAAALDATARGMGLAALLERHPGSLSMGEKQRTLIAAALAAGRAVLLLDEPTSGMDPGRMDQLARALGDWAAAGRAAVVATHDEAFIQAAATRRMTLHHGLLTPATRATGEEE